MAYDASSDDVKKLREEAEHDTELAKEREERQRRAREEQHAAVVTREIRELAFELDRKQRELDGLSYETSSLEHAIRAGSHSTGSSALERQRSAVHDLKERLDRLKADRRSNESRLTERERALSRNQQVTERDAREEASTLEHLRDQLAETLTTLGSLARERDSLARSGHNDEVGSKSKEEAEERAIERLEAEKSRLESADRVATGKESDLRHALITDKREAERATPRTSTHAYEDAAEVRKDRTAIDKLRRDIASDQAEVRVLMERITEKETRLRSLETALSDVEGKMRGRRDTVHRTDTSALLHKVEQDQEEIEHLEASHKEVTGRIRELTDEIEDHKERLAALTRSTERLSSSRTTSHEALDRKISEAERARDLLQSQIRTAESRADHHTSEQIRREENEVRSGKQEAERISREERTTETELRTAERELERMESEEEQVEERGRTAAQRKRVQDERKRKLSESIEDLKRKIAAKKQEIS